MIDLAALEKDIMSGLKDFQRATVERVLDRFKANQNRVLIADEVGLGKTLIAKGVIAKTARWHREDKNDNLFKVVYICSNQGIATQNIQKLIITKKAEDITVGRIDDMRLSMQHLKIFQQEKDPAVLDKYIQLIPLTPQTSFSMTNGCGSVAERALMFAIMKRMEAFQGFLPELEIIMTDCAVSSWNSWVADYYERQVKKCDEKTGGLYTQYVSEKLLTCIRERELLDKIIDVCLKVRAGGMKRVYGTYGPLNDLRRAFAQISLEKLEPDLIIMDEFQRFRYLIDAQNDDSEMGLLVSKFFSGDNTKVLLLSATPFKLYSTLEEIDELQIDEHYSEFLQVMGFLLNDKEKQESFKTIWSDYTMKIREVEIGGYSVIEAKKFAEDAMFESICRTERYEAVKNGGFIDDSSIKSPLAIGDKDIKSYIEAEKLLAEIGLKCGVPVDYVKSSPFILSFMDHYKLKEKVQDYFKTHRSQVSVLNKPGRHSLLWLQRADIDNYRELPNTNARLKKLKEIAFEGGSELLMWVPPSLPYYELSGAYKGKKNFSKILVFSSWEMVPRMIACMLSYEAERKTVGRLIMQTGETRNTHYFDETRYPYPKLSFKANRGKAETMSLFALLYPSKTLAALYDPLDCKNKRLSLRNIEKMIKAKLKSLLKELNNGKKAGGRVDNRWYYLAPMLLDGRKYAGNWFKQGARLIAAEDEDDDDRGGKAFRKNLGQLQHEFYKGKPLGKQPSDLYEVLADMAIGSPAICAYRSNGNDPVSASRFAKIMLNRFNVQEMTAAVELVYGKRSDDAHWKNVLKYFCDGCFQAVFDEYVHMLFESHNLSALENGYTLLNEYILESSGIRTATYPVDTYNAFTSRLSGRVNNEDKKMKMRSHFAVGFYLVGGNQQGINRKESVRNAFNSPFRPFVLATTSIGQEGLDFHYYCRKIMHWNLPSNPIDLEQREGRINRFKCLAIRQNIAEKYGDMFFHHNAWDEMFREAAKSLKDAESSDLVPFWCLSDEQDIKIERIVPLYPLSRDVGSYERLIKILSLYRLTLGQPRQEELLDYILHNDIPADTLKELFINLSPYYREKNLNIN